MNDTALIPVAIVAGEVGADTDELAARLGNAVTLDAIGVRCIPADTAVDLITDHRAALQAERDRKAAQREAARQRPHPVRERIRALQRQQEEWQGDPDTPALARALAGDPESRFNKSDAALAEMMSGQVVQHRFRRGEDR